MTPFWTVVTRFWTPQNRHKSSIFDEVAENFDSFFGLKVISIYLPYNHTIFFRKSYCNQSKFIFWKSACQLSRKNGLSKLPSFMKYQSQRKKNRILPNGSKFTLVSRNTNNFGFILTSIKNEFFCWVHPTFLFTGGWFLTKMGRPQISNLRLLAWPKSLYPDQNALNSKIEAPIQTQMPQKATVQKRVKAMSSK